MLKIIQGRRGEPGTTFSSRKFLAPQKHKRSWLFHLERGRKWGGGGRAEGETKKQVGGGIEKTPDVGEQGRQESKLRPLCS